MRTEKFRRRTWMRKALDILVMHTDRDDLNRIRRAIDDDEVDPSFSDIRYFNAWGDWSDIDRIVKIYSDHRSAGPGNTLLMLRKMPTLFTAKTIMKVGKSRTPDLLALKLPAGLLAAIIVSLSKKSFLALKDDKLIELMQRKSDEVRKVAALRTVELHSVARLKRIAGRYEQLSERFYNVIRWLDLALAFAEETAKLAAKRELQSVASKWHAPLTPQVD